MDRLEFSLHLRWAPALSWCCVFLPDSTRQFHFFKLASTFLVAVESAALKLS